MLRIRNLDTRLVSGIRLDVADGQCICIHGDSGSGKTLLLRAIADLDPNSGELVLNGTPRHNMPANLWRQQVTYLPAESHWWQETVSEHFVSEVIPYESLGLPAGIAQWSVQRLSTGERQRLSLLRALDHQPSVLLMDETTANLDEENTHKVEAFVRSRLNDGLSVIWVSHSKAQRERMADACFAIKNGKLGKDTCS